MNSANVRRFLGHWCRFAFRNALAQTFSWPTMISAVVLGYSLPKILGIRAFPNQVETNLAVAAVSLVIALGVNMVIAPFKAYRAVRPFVVSVTDDVRSPDFVFNENVRGYNATVVVHNRSSLFIKDCVAHVLNAPSRDGSVQPRFVEQFDLPPKSKKNVFIAYWFSRESNGGDDRDIGISGPMSPTFGGNICRVSAPAILNVKVHAPDVDSKDVACRVWIDAATRRLKAEELLPARAD
jgi:hypothetical protein